MSASSCQYLLDRINKLKAIIEKYEDAIDALLVGGVQSYTLDTGQSRQTVTRADLKDLEEGLERKLNSLFMLENRYCNQCGPGGAGTTTARPVW